jgi:hypothetical protein
LPLGAGDIIGVPAVVRSQHQTYLPAALRGPARDGSSAIAQDPEERAARAEPRYPRARTTWHSGPRRSLLAAAHERSSRVASPFPRCATGRCHCFLPSRGSGACGASASATPLVLLDKKSSSTGPSMTAIPGWGPAGRRHRRQLRRSGSGTGWGRGPSLRPGRLSRVRHGNGPAGPAADRPADINFRDGE